MTRTSWSRLVGPLAIAVTAVGIAVPLVTAHAATNPTASVDLAHRAVYRNHTSTTYTFTVNAGSSAAVAAVAIANTSNPVGAIDISSCPAGPTGWTHALTTINGVETCVFGKGTGTAIPAGQSSSAFQVSASTPAGNGAAFSGWIVFANTTRALASATAALATTVYNVQITDAEIVNSAVTPGQACPGSSPANHTAHALDTGLRMVVCGINWGSNTFTPNATDSKFVGTFAIKGTLENGTVAGNPGGNNTPRVLANYKDVVIGPTPGAAIQFAALVQSLSNTTPSLALPRVAKLPYTPLTGYTILCSADYTVDGANGSNSNSGDCGSPFKTIAKAMSVVAAGESVQIEPLPRGAGNTITPYSETVNIPDNVFVSGDMLKLAQKNPVEISGNVGVGKGSGLQGLVVVGQTTYDNNSTSFATIHASPGATCLSQTGTGVSYDTVIVAGCNQGLNATNNSTGTVRNSVFAANTTGVHVASANGRVDLGTTGSHGANTLCQSTLADLWDQAGTGLNPVTINAVGNAWDASPPSYNAAPVGGADTVFLKPTALTGQNVNASSSSVATNALCTGAANPLDVNALLDVLASLLG